MACRRRIDRNYFQDYLRFCLRCQFHSRWGQGPIIGLLVMLVGFFLAKGEILLDPVARTMEVIFKITSMPGIIRSRERFGKNIRHNSFKW